MSVGVHQLVRKGMAVLVTNAAEVVDAVGRIGDDLASEARGPVHPRDGLDPEVARVLDALPQRGSRDVDTIAVRAGLATDSVLAALGNLRGAGWVERVSGGWRRARP
jgi:DNA processing protein